MMASHTDYLYLIFIGIGDLVVSGGEDRKVHSNNQIRIYRTVYMHMYMHINQSRLYCL